MREINKIAEGLFEKIRDRFEDVSLGDDKAKATTDPEKARFFNFDYSVNDTNYGNITISLIDEMSLKVYFSKNISKDLDKEQRDVWYSFLRELREFAKRNMLSFEPRDITRSTLKHRDLKQVSKADNTYDKDDVVAESRLYGTSKSSYEKFGPVRIIVRHDKPVVDEVGGARSRHIKSVYVENAEGERFKMPFKSLTASRAMARHISAGGTPHDELGQHITEMAVEATKLKPFLNNVRRRTFEDQETHAMVESAFEYHALLKNTLQRLSGKKGYTTCKEQFSATSTSYIPEDDMDIAAIKERFVKRVYNDKMEEALPLVYKAYDMKKNNKFTEQFESWANVVSEGAWALPETDDEIGQLIDIMEKPLPVGVDAQNATNALYNILGDDRLFDRLEQLAEQDPEADARDVVASWLQDNLPHIYQQIENEIGDADTPAEPAEDNQEVDESYPPQVVIGGKQVDLGSIELDGVESFDRPDYADAYAVAAEFTDGTPLSEQELEELSEKHGDVINMVAHEMLEGNTYGSGDGGMDGQVNEDDEDLLANTEAIQSAIIRRILNDINQHSELLKKAGPDGVMNAASDVASFHAPMEEIGSSDVSIMVREVYREVGVDYPEDEHNDLHEAFDRLVNEGAINVGDMIRDKTQPEIQGKVVGDMEENYTIKVDDDIYHIKKLNAEKVANESVAGDDHVNKDIKMKRMGAKELSISDKFKIMPSQYQAMKKGDSENDLLHYNKLQAKNTVAENEFNEAIEQMRKIAGLQK